MGKRVQWIDIAKGLGAIFVILGHFIKISELATFIYAFHMPLFFILAGITFKVKEDEVFKDFLQKKVKTIMIPYLIFSIPLYLYNIFCIIHGGNNVLPSMIKKTLGIFLCWKTKSVYNGVWFLPCMFFTYLIAYVVQKYLKNNRMIVFSALASLLIGALLKLAHITLPYGIDTAFIAYSFFGIGYAYKEKINNVQSWSVLLYVPMAVVAFINYTLSGIRVEMYNNDYGNIALFYIAAILGCIATIGFAKNIFINSITFFSKIGKESMYLYGAQLIFLIIFNNVVKKIEMASFNNVVIWLIGITVSVLIFSIIWLLKPMYYKFYNWLVLR